MERSFQKRLTQQSEHNLRPRHQDGDVFGYADKGFKGFADELHNIPVLDRPVDRTIDISGPLSDSKHVKFFPISAHFRPETTLPTQHTCAPFSTKYCR
jgi:hypothetical protein